MKKLISKKIIILKYILFILTLVFYSCNLEVKAPKRIDLIPKTAFWAGGADGGNWYNIESVHPHNNNVVISVFNDQNGKLIVSKRFFLICTSDSLMKIPENLSKKINSYDGVNIYLKSTKCYLK